MLAFTQSCGLSGIDGFAVTVEVNLAHGIPQFDIVGLPDASVKESRERVRAAQELHSARAPPLRAQAPLPQVQPRGPDYAGAPARTAAWPPAGRERGRTPPLPTRPQTKRHMRRRRGPPRKEAGRPTAWGNRAAVRAPVSVQTRAAARTAPEPVEPQEAVAERRGPRSPGQLAAGWQPRAVVRPHAMRAAPTSPRAVPQRSLAPPRHRPRDDGRTPAPRWGR